MADKPGFTGGDIIPNHSLIVMKIDLERLEKVRERGTKTIARCPACAEMQQDTGGDNLTVFSNGDFACAAHMADRQHARRILALAGSDTGGHGHESGVRPQQSRAGFPAPMLLQKPVQLEPWVFGSALAHAACQRLSESEERQARVAAEFGVRVETIRCLGAEEGRIGLFSDLSIGGRSCLPDRIGYIYPQGIKIRHPWGPKSRVRFAWACGRATEPWRFILASWRPWVRNYIITEGESDLIALLDAGMENLTLKGDTAIVASPGISFKPEWAAGFKGLNVTLMFDSDTSGAAGAQRTAALLRPHAAQIRILNLPSQP